MLTKGQNHMAMIVKRNSMSRTWTTNIWRKLVRVLLSPLTRWVYLASRWTFSLICHGYWQAVQSPLQFISSKMNSCTNNVSTEFCHVITHNLCQIHRTLGMQCIPSHHNLNREEESEEVEKLTHTKGAVNSLFNTRQDLPEPTAPSP